MSLTELASMIKLLTDELQVKNKIIAKLEEEKQKLLTVSEQATDLLLKLSAEHEKLKKSVEGPKFSDPTV